MSDLETNMQLLINSMRQFDQQIALLAMKNEAASEELRREQASLKEVMLKMRDEQFAPLLDEMRGTEEIFRLEMVNRLLDRIDRIDRKP